MSFIKTKRVIRSFTALKLKPYYFIRLFLTHSQAVTQITSSQHSSFFVKNQNHTQSSEVKNQKSQTRLRLEWWRLLLRPFFVDPSSSLLGAVSLSLSRCVFWGFKSPSKKSSDTPKNRPIHRKIAIHLLVSSDTCPNTIHQPICIEITSRSYIVRY